MGFFCFCSRGKWIPRYNNMSWALITGTLGVSLQLLAPISLMLTQWCHMTPSNTIFGQHWTISFFNSILKTLRDNWFGWRKTEMSSCVNWGVNKVYDNRFRYVPLDFKQLSKFVDKNTILLHLYSKSSQHALCICSNSKTWLYGNQCANAFQNIDIVDHYLAIRHMCIIQAM